MSPDRYYGVARTAAELRRALELREHVFCREQGVSRELEFDGRDAEATQLVGIEDGELVATCRLLYEGSTCRLGRMAVAAKKRRSGVGERLLEEAEDEARAAGAAELLVHAQREAQPFYAKSRFVAEGEPFVEDDIPHVAMRKPVPDG